MSKSDRKSRAALAGHIIRIKTRKFKGRAKVRLKAAAFPVCVATALLLSYPSLVSYQDIASLSPELSTQASSNRWLASITQTPGVSTIVPNIDNISTSAIELDNFEEIDIRSQFTTKLKTEKLTQKVNRSQKGDRVVSSTIASPPIHFSAGTVVQRHSMLETLDIGSDYELAFVKAKPAEEAFLVASAFHLKKDPATNPQINADLPVVVASLVRESAPNLLSYADEPKLTRSPFAAILDSDTPVNIIPRLNKGDHSWADDPLPKASFSKREQQCLTAGIYFEARGEPVRGQAAVAQVILNRVKNPTYPNSICGVVYQNKHWRNRCQFSFACDRIKDKVNDHKRWSTAQFVARETTEGRIWLKQVGSSTHYHATYVRPKWAGAMKKVGRIGLHIFYRTFNGGWS